MLKLSFVLGLIYGSGWFYFLYKFAEASGVL